MVMAASLPAAIRQLFGETLSTTMIFTAGNSLRQDDGVGPYVAAQLREQPAALVVDGGFTPDSVVEDVIAAQPARIIFIDAADFGGQPGEVRLLEPEKSLEVLVSSHTIPLSLVADLIRQRLPATTMCFVGIQVQSLDFGEGLCPEVQKSADQLVSLIGENFPQP